jgi:hypothetical protein
VRRLLLVHFLVCWLLLFNTWLASAVCLAGRGSSFWLALLSSLEHVIQVLIKPQEGVFTALFGLITFLIGVPASPSQISSRILTEKERVAYCAALAEDWSGDADTDGREEETFSWTEVWSIFTDAKHVLLICLPLFFSGVTVRQLRWWLLSVLIISHTFPQLYGLANFTPTIVGALGFSATRTQLLTVGDVP